jgi:hypothetical protein
VGDGSLQSHSGVNLNPKMAKNRGSVLKGGEANGVALTQIPVQIRVFRLVVITLQIIGICGLVYYYRLDDQLDSNFSIQIKLNLGYIFL